MEPTNLKPPHRPPSFLDLAFDPAVVRRAFLMAVVVGTLLIAINHGRCMLSNKFGSMCLIASALTFFVPYAVSTYSSILAIRNSSDS
jgi:hypothetical protein